MSVISRNRAEEFYLIELTPWSVATNTKHFCTGNLIIHDIQAGVTIYNHIFRFRSDHICYQFFSFRNTIKDTIVSQICTVFTL